MLSSAIWSRFASAPRRGPFVGKVSTRAKKKKHRATDGMYRIVCLHWTTRAVGTSIHFRAIFSLGNACGCERRSVSRVDEVTTGVCNDIDSRYEYGIRYLGICQYRARRLPRLHVVEKAE